MTDPRIPQAGDAPTKECSSCKNRLPATQEFFYPSKTQIWQAYCRNCKNQYKVNWRLKLRSDVLAAYSGQKPKCSCCGESYIELLSIDHMNGNGKSHRKAIGGRDAQSGGAEKLYAWLKKNN
jgi:hypothetical protein